MGGVAWEGCCMGGCNTQAPGVTRGCNAQTHKYSSNLLQQYGCISLVEIILLGDMLDTFAHFTTPVVGVDFITQAATVYGSRKSDTEAMSKVFAG